MTSPFLPETGPRTLLSLTPDGYELRGYILARGTPEGGVTADPGSVYVDSDTGIMYIKDTGTGNTGWAAGSGPGGNPVFNTVTVTSAGSAGAPSVSVGNTDTGLYDPVAHQIALTAAGVQALKATSTGVTVPGTLTVTAGPAFFPAGVTAAPSVSIGSTDSGVYASSAHAVDIAAGGVDAMTVTATGITFHVPTASNTTLFPAGAAAAPAIALADADTGVYSAGSHTLGLAAGGTAALTATSTVVTIPNALTVTTGPITAPAGTVGAPSVNIREATTGLYSTGTGVLNAATGGVTALTLTSTIATVPGSLTATLGPISTVAGTAGAPGVTVRSSNYGLFSSAANHVSLSAAGTQAFDATATAAVVPGSFTATLGPIATAAGSVGSVALATRDGATGVYSANASEVDLGAGGVNVAAFTATTAVVPGSLTATLGPITTAAGTVGAPAVAVREATTGIYSLGSGSLSAAAGGSNAGTFTSTTATFPGAVNSATSSVTTATATTGNITTVNATTVNATTTVSPTVTAATVVNTPSVSSASPQGALYTTHVAENTLTLSGAGSAIAPVPANGIVRAYTIRVITAVTGVAVTGMNLGDTSGGAPTLYGTNIGLTLGTTTSPANYLRPYQFPATTTGDFQVLPIGGTFTGGVVRVTAYYDVVSAATA